MIGPTGCILSGRGQMSVGFAFSWHECELLNDLARIFVEDLTDINLNLNKLKLSKV
jgi:hypothetical protein